MVYKSIWLKYIYGNYNLSAYIREIIFSAYIRSKDLYAIWGIIFGMDYWYEIVKRYDDHNSIDPNRRDDGIYSQSSVVILLIYLAFGEDHPYHIAKYFEKIYFDQDDKIPYSSNLRTSKVGTLLNKMKEDELVTVTEKVVKGKPTKIYSINPRVIQSPIRDGTYIKRDGSTFEIPLEMVEHLLAWKDWKYEESKRVCDRDEFFKIVDFPVYESDKLSKIVDYTAAVNYFRFLEFLETKAAYRDWELRKPSYLENLLRDYYDEIRDHYGGILFFPGNMLNLWRQR